ncbi:MAG: DUF4245 family protein [Rhodoluna sp.]|nr:DUF4245 family protein [Rhodoluna sp.]
MSDQKAKEHRAKQTVNNLLLSLLATAGMVLVMILIVPRDDSSRIPRIDYIAVASQASESSKHKIVAPVLPKDWWSNQATWLGNPVDAVPRFEVGFVGPKNEYIGLTHAFGVNATWLALTLKDVVLEKNVVNPGSPNTWNTYRSPVVHQPVETRDYIWVSQVGSNAVLLYGTGTEAQFLTLSKNVDAQLEAK